MTEELQIREREEIEDAPEQRNESLSAKNVVLPDCVTVFISGPVASGKSHLIKQLVDRMERSLVLDMMAEYGGEGYEEIWANPQALAERLEKNPHYFRIAYHPKNIPVDFHWCYVAIWQLTLPRWFIIEEVHEVCGSNSILDDMKDILRYSRHNMLGIVASSQRIAEVNKLLTSVARMIILFHTTEFRDIQAIDDRFGRDVAEAVQNLRPCIYDDSSKTLEQAPECVIYIRGMGWKVVSLGDKIQTQEIDRWHEVLEEQPKKQNQLSSQQDSGNPESNSPEDM